jgi:hypothetical protein
VLAGKVKTALDETRTLILGAQILLGFQCQSAFQERFDSLGSANRNMSAMALLLMLLAVGLLITPSHFIVSSRTARALAACTARRDIRGGGDAALRRRPWPRSHAYP